MRTAICQLTGESFEIGPIEEKLRAKFELSGVPKYSPQIRLLWLGAFWQHWNLYPRKCDKTGKDIISTYRPDCPYKVYEREEWLKSDDIVGADIDISDPTNTVFKQMKGFFFKNTIPHNESVNSENCYYAIWVANSKNVYLSINTLDSENIRYGYRTVNNRDCSYVCSSFDCELCLDVINCKTCYNSIYLLNCQKCVDSAFLYDCRNCNDCFLSSNLRNKQYYFANKQYSKEEYFKLKSEYNMKSRSVYEQLKTHFKTMMKEHSYHKALFHDRCENSSGGDYLANCKDCEGCYFMQNGQDCANYIRPVKVTDSLDCIGGGANSSLLHLCMGCYYNAFDCRYCLFCRQCSYIEYCMYCMQCEHCFGCVGLKNKKYHIFNKPYTETEYFMKKKELIEFMKNTGEYGDFFPFEFAPCPYQDSISGYYWPLSEDDMKHLGMWSTPPETREKGSCKPISELPDNADDMPAELLQVGFWDDIASKPFQVFPEDVAFSKKTNTPLPYTNFIRRLQENFRWMPFDGTLKDAVCMDCKAHVKTSWGPEYHHNLLCDTCYDKRIG